ncbi:MAG: hypothetical protein R3D98_02045 [Candidatus Krumholzibacteriia bacterium]
MAIKSPAPAAAPDLHATLLCLLLTCLLLAGHPVAAEPLPPDWPYDTDFDDDLLHVHPELNYTQHPDWVARWERDRLGAGAFTGAFGSSATDELLIDAHWALNPRLGEGGLRLRQDIVWEQRRHLPHDRLDLWLGLEQRLSGPWGVVVQATPAEDKEEIDLRLGGLWTSPDRTQYVQLLYLAEDITADEKDPRAPDTHDPARGVAWLVRLARGDWSMYSSGHWTGGHARRFPDPGASPELRAASRRSDDLVVRVRWRPAPRTHLELAWRQAEDAAARAYRGEATVYDRDYAGWYRTLSARGLVPLAPRWRLRAELHGLARRATVSGWRAMSYHRDEVLPGVWAEWSVGRDHWLELGYLGTFSRWQDAGLAERSGFADKVELAAVFNLGDGAGLKASLSHEVSLQRFGGASVRMVTGF